MTQHKSCANLAPDLGCDRRARETSRDRLGPVIKFAVVIDLVNILRAAESSAGTSFFGQPFFSAAILGA